ncbi:hypothetical protein SAMN05421805_107231 [Saccharopolyspora antimicrobica]|uniref:Sporulation and spore germination n=1 Tax=Saccharopolyspora antimicrobica TaxID=455193 RepID=A0A1I5CML0_9PSEU|nr:hypothetical protein [Saccharopolyspora antimicrobica]RKT88808.1 hypothetical protein ATL45_7249 [Saccharopolyspora antimicrobica]SFN88265.1 hypothetical protein SAMN05421805_107231 [Saccharopolyspora antimicrobica]
MTRTLRTVLVAGALLALADCGVQPSGIIYGSSPPSGAVAAPATFASLYLVSDGRLARIVRSAGPMSRAEALEMLAQGPTEEERERGLTTEVPAEAAPFTVTTDVSGRTVVTVSAPTGQLSALAIDQIACTAAADGGQVVIIGAGTGSDPVVCPLR